MSKSGFVVSIDGNDYELPKMVAYLIEDQRQEIKDLRKGIYGVIDLLRTGMPPDAFGMGTKAEWTDYKVNKSADELHNLFINTKPDSVMGE
jgi:hypothetical protein